MTQLTHSHLGKITFLGAALEVTGSCHLLEVNDLRILLDCGMHQGGSAFRRNSGEFDFDPSSIDMVVLSHAHLDHSGALPLLVAQGFSGPIFCTEGTSKLLPILLEDAFHLYERDVFHRNTRLKRAGKQMLELQYHLSDVEQVLSLVKTSRYQQPVQIGDGTQLQFYDAGHILGSSIVELFVTQGEVSKTLVFSGDLGNPDTSLMYDPVKLKQADIVLMESTYGDRNHRSHTATLAEFEGIIEAAGCEDGNILIPAFAVGRTQELLFALGCLYQEGKLDGWQVFLDSPMAKAVTDVYNQCLSRLDRKDTAVMRQYGSLSLQAFLPCLTVSESVEDSILINDRKSKAIIIAGSGMCTGGRIRHHFKQRIWRQNTHIIFVGFQAAGTIGRKLVEGEKRMKFFGEEMVINAQVHTVGGFSAHAGQDELVEWANAFTGKPKFCLVHGEQKAVVALRDALLTRADIDAEIAVKGASVYF
ncbi:MBL fold metallo-hydrolase [Arenicella chitinivorans]|uniref:MBL fold metallo-hydrolase n=1 Tax=Arenicella chitinivorans TaxID=1329800 RepID=A0A918S1U6_9GAMM|nr:MBL fold metallo-hydrolase [Arenicella chitinivorans]GHA20763.1 MBL fold metallo-hydrolase [Arenicella chitinivorans]